MSALPTVRPAPPLRFAGVTDRSLSNGLRVLVVRRASVPRVEVRLQVPTGRVTTSSGYACASLLARTLTGGTERRDQEAIGVELQRQGARLVAFGDMEQLVIGGAVLRPYLGEFLVLVSEVLTTPSFPHAEVAFQRELLARELHRAASDAGAVARQALLHQIYGRHPYARAMPDPAAVAEVSVASLRRAHRHRVRPTGAVLVIVGDTTGRAAFAAAEGAFGAWAGGGAATTDSPPVVPRQAVTRMVHRPGALQTAIRIGGPAAPLAHPDSAALSVANNILGGHSASRLSQNLRERKGYTYSVGCGVQRRLGAAHVQVVTDVATDFTAPALVELRYELSRLVTEPVGAEELELSRRQLCGNLCLSMQSQAGLVSGLTAVASSGLGPGYLEEQLAAVARVTADDVLRVAARYLAPRGLQTVLVGDAERVAPAVGALDDFHVEHRP